MTNQRIMAVIFEALLCTSISISCVSYPPPTSETTIKTASAITENRQFVQEKQVHKKQKAKPITVTGTEISQQKNPYVDAEITTKIIPSINNTFGYEIHITGSSLMQVIYQPNIPGMSGNEGFSTREKAQKVADFVANKIRRNEMPPIVKPSDLNTLGVLK